MNIKNRRKKVIPVLFLIIYIVGIFFCGWITEGQSDNSVQAAQAVKTPTLSIDYRTATTATMKLSKVSSAAGYRIYRATSLHGQYKLVGTTKSQTFKDTGLTYSQKYYYKARAYRTVSGKQVFSSYSKVAGLAGTVGKTNRFLASTSNRGVELTWSKVSSASKYNIYRSTSLSGTYSYIGSSYGQTFIDDEVAKGKTYYYRIRGYKKGTVIRYYGVYSDKVRITVPLKAEENGAQTDTSSNTAFTKEVLRLVNVEREKEGLSSLSTNKTLEKAAFIRAKETEELFDHTRPDGTSCFTVLEDENISYMAAGENIAYGQRDPEDVVDAWMNSPGHRANILSTKFGKVGIGCYINKNGTIYWTQLFTN